MVGGRATRRAFMVWGVFMAWGASGCRCAGGDIRARSGGRRGKSGRRGGVHWELVLRFIESCKGGGAAKLELKLAGSACFDDGLVTNRRGRLTPTIQCSIVPWAPRSCDRQIVLRRRRSGGTASLLHGVEAEREAWARERRSG